MKKKPLKNKIDKANLNDTITPLRDNLETKLETKLDARIDRNTTSLITEAQYKLDTDKSLYDNMQVFLDQNFDTKKYNGKSQITSGSVIYEDRNHRTEVIFEGHFEDIGNYSYNSQTEKIKDTLEEYLITQYLETQSPTIFITIKDLAKEINVRASDLRKRIYYIIESLKTIRLSYKTKGKLKNVYTDFADIRIISSSEYHEETDLLEVNFDNKYAYNIASHKFFQLPKKYRQINDNTYQYAYPLAKYIFGLCRRGRNTITFKSLYEQIKKIPRIEEIRKHRASPTQKIYEPLIKHFIELNTKNDFEISFENEKEFLTASDTKKNIDFDKMLNAKIIIKWKNKPNYDKLEQSKKQYQNKIIRNRQKQIEKATRKLLAQ